MPTAHPFERALDTLLDLDRISRAILEPNRVLIDISAVAHRVALELAEPGRPVRIDSGSVRAEVDPVLVERILENLVANALKYAGTEAAVELSVSLDKADVLIVVDDRGPGVPDDLKEAIWDPFQRGTSLHSGTGIGLTVVQRFAELHGGRAWVEDRPGGGASFRVSLPGAVES